MARSLSDLMKSGYVATRNLRARLEELTRSTFEVYRLKNGEVLGQFSDDDSARDYITEEDYDPSRVTFREVDGVSDENRAEVEKLSRFRDAVLQVKDDSYWDGSRDKAFYKLLPGSPVIEVDGVRYAMLDDLWRN